MPDITSAGERWDLSGWNPAREAFLLALHIPAFPHFVTEEL
jgi:hypothetical protein